MDKGESIRVLSAVIFISGDIVVFLWSCLGVWDAATSHARSLTHSQFMSVSAADAVCSWVDQNVE
jgi:hypothetical protein